MKAHRAGWLAIAVLGSCLSGCATQHERCTADGRAEACHDAALPDAALADTGPPDAGVDAATASCPGPIATGELPFGISVGRPFAGFTLPRCDGTDFHFYDEEFCAPEHTLTVLVQVSPECAPAESQSRALARSLGYYRSRGVRIIEIMTQGFSHVSITPEVCEAWVSRTGSATVLMDDSAAVSSSFFPDRVFPSTLIIDREGIIRYRQDGFHGWDAFGAELDALLASP